MKFREYLVENKQEDKNWIDFMVKDINAGNQKFIDKITGGGDFTFAKGGNSNKIDSEYQELFNYLENLYGDGTIKRFEKLFVKTVGADIKYSYFDIKGPLYQISGGNNNAPLKKNVIKHTS